MKKIILIFCWTCCTLSSLLAHGNVHERILSLSKEITSHPDSALLYLMRGELYNEHQQYKKAIKDFKRAKRKGLKSDRLFMALAKSYYQKNKYRKSLRQLNQILKKEPAHVRALRLRGNVLMSQMKYCEATEPLDIVVLTVKERLVENYLEAARAWTKCNKTKAKTRAKKVLENGIADLGPLLIFYEKLKDLALAQEDFDTAIAQQTAIINYSIRKEKPYFERALLYIENTNKKEALEDLQMSQNLLNQLPIRFQKMEAMQTLRQRISETLLLLKK